MDRPAQPIDEAPVPSAGRVVLGALPGALIAIPGIPLLAWWLLDDAGEARTIWWPVPVIALFSLMVLTDRYTHAPRPTAEQRVSRERLTWALSSAPRKGTVPKDPLLRDAVVATACSSIETLVFLGAILVGAAFGALIRPEFSWLTAVSGMLGVTLVAAFQFHRHWGRLKALHASDRND